MPNRDPPPASNLGNEHREPDRRPEDARDRIGPWPGGRDEPKGEADAVDKTTRRGERRGARIHDAKET